MLPQRPAKESWLPGNIDYLMASWLTGAWLCTLSASGKMGMQRRQGRPAMPPSLYRLEFGLIIAYVSNPF